jgi:hypothetical protein
MGGVGACNAITIYGLSTVDVAPSCNFDLPPSSFTPPSAIPARKELRQICCGVVASCLRQQIESKSTAVGVTEDRYVILCQLSTDKDLKSLGKSIYARVTDGINWKNFEGAIEQVNHWGIYLRLVVNPGLAIPEAIR